MRGRLRDDGADEVVLASIDPVVQGAHAAGQTLVVIAGSSGVLYTAHLPELPAEGDVGFVGELPHLAPLLAATQALLPHIVVATDRRGAELIAVLPDREDREAKVSGEELHITRSAPGGWSQRRFQQRAENVWESNAGEVADALTRLVDSNNPRVVIVSGDVRAVQFLRDQVPVRVADLLTEVQGDYRTLDEALRRSGQVVADVAEEDTRALLDAYLAGQGSDRLSAAGPQAALAALREGRAEALLVDPTQVGEDQAWFGPELMQAAESEAELKTVGVLDGRTAPLVDVAVRAAAGTAARVRIMPAGTTELAPTGIGVLLRYS